MLSRVTGPFARVIVLLIGIAATVASATIDDPTVAVVAAVATAIVLVVQFFSAGPSVVAFEAAEWKPGGDGWVIEVPWRRHLRAWPTVEVVRAADDGWFEVIYCDVKTRGHTVRVSIAGDTFAGEIRVT